MPLNPNGKIDKPALPFPDTAQATFSAPPTRQASSTEKTVQNIWTNILPNPPTPLPLDESFFDLGGHSILATRLVFEIRKVFLVNAPLGLIFEQPTITGLATAIDELRNADLGLTDKRTDGAPTMERIAGAPAKLSIEYGQDLAKLLPLLKESYPSLPVDYRTRPLEVFLTGGTGFLGAFVLRALLRHQERVKKVTCLVRAPDAQQGLARLKEGLSGRGVWDDQWVESGRLEVVVGDLSLEFLGLSKDNWSRITNETDVILHNGALVR
jgi:L-2-aminoadipate reductase